jgi:hypothetical protein
MELVYIEGMIKTLETIATRWFGSGNSGLFRNRKVSDAEYP